MIKEFHTFESRVGAYYTFKDSKQIDIQNIQVPIKQSPEKVKFATDILSPQLEIFLCTIKRKLLLRIRKFKKILQKTWLRNY